METIGRTETKQRRLTRREFGKYSCVAIGAMGATSLFPGVNVIATTLKADAFQTGTLKVPGAQLYYETRGRGPLMIMIPGANGEANVFKWVAEHLSASYRVATYDRRGFSRSKLDGPQDYDHRIETDADDVRRLIEHLSDEPATVFGASSGGIVALEVLTHHPSVVRTLIPFEPAAVKELPDGRKWLDFFSGLFDLYLQSGAEPAIKKFREQAFAESDRRAMASAPKNEYTLANVTYWFEHELRQYPAIDLDLDALKANADRIVLMAGRESRGYPCYEVNMELSKKLNRNLIELPGGHGGFASQPTDFAREFVQALARIGHGPKK